MINIHFECLLEVVVDLQVLSMRMLRLHLKDKVPASREYVLRVEDARI